MVKSFIVFSTLNLSRQSDRERLCVTVSSLKSGKKKKKEERKLVKRSEIIQAMPPVGTRGGAWLPGTMAHSSCRREAQPHASACIQVSAKAACACAHSPGSWARTELCVFQERSLRGQAHYTKSLKQTHHHRQSDIKGIIKAQTSIYICRNRC